MENRMHRAAPGGLGSLVATLVATTCLLSSASEGPAPTRAVRQPQPLGSEVRRQEAPSLESPESQPPAEGGRPLLPGQDEEGRRAPTDGTERLPQDEPDTPPSVPRRPGGPRAPALRTFGPSTSLLAARMTRTPDMFGDFFNDGGRLTFLQQGQVGIFDLPNAGGSRRVKVAEHGNALPQDRVFFSYQHFHNVMDANTTLNATPESFPVDRFNLGLEKTLLDGLWSVELRMPFHTDFDFTDPTGVFAIDGDRIGNLSIIVKGLLYEDGVHAWSAGLGIDTPTGSDVQARTFGTEFRITNDAVHLLPYIGALCVPSDRLYFHAFVQADLVAGNNTVLRTATMGPSAGVPVPLGTYTEQNLLYVDVGGGYWVYRNMSAPHITGVAATLEFHYTTAVQDTDLFFNRVDGEEDIIIANPSNRYDALNMTVGLNTEIGPLTHVRVAGVLPLRTEDEDKLFDAEVQVALTRKY